MHLHESPSPARWRSRLPQMLSVAAGMLVLITLVRWGGTARPGPLYMLGVGVLLGLILGFAALAWWLYFSPIPAAFAPTHPVSVRTRQIVAILVLLSGMLFSVGGFWDEVWHRRFGSFGDDFLWPPHMLIYGGIFLIMLFAGGALLGVLREQGSLRQRFRNESLIGFLGLVAAYLIVSLPSDQLWHIIYGRDLTAWSLPHIILNGGMDALLLVGVALQLSLIPRLPWRGLRHLSWQELLVLLLVSLVTINLVQIGVAEWDNIRRIPQQINTPFQQAFWGRPEWLYPVLIVAIGLFCGNVALYTLRRVGAATFVALFVLGFRIIVLGLTDAWSSEVNMRFISHLLLLPSMVALDLWFAIRMHHISALKTLIVGNIVAGIIGLSCVLPIIAYTLVYPRVNVAILPTTIGIGIVVAIVVGMLGMRIGTWVLRLSHTGMVSSP